MLAAAMLAGGAAALPVPVDSADGLTLRIEGLDPLPPPAKSMRTKAALGAPERKASEPLALAFTVSNGTARAVSGVFRAWMNDDWSLDGAPQEELTLAPGQMRTLRRTARAGCRVLPALYPVHAQFTCGPTQLHPVAIFRAETPNRAFGRRAAVRSGNGAIVLEPGGRRRVAVQTGGAPWRQLDTAEMADAETAASFRSEEHGVWCGGVRKRGYSGHPPWRKGCGTIRSVWTVTLPAVRPCRLRFAVGVPSAKSDGVGIRVRVAGDVAYATNQTVTACWMEHEADMSRWAGMRAEIAIEVDAGERKNTSYDSFVLSDPLVISGMAGPLPTAAEWAVRAEEARARARAALASGTDATAGRYRLELDGDAYGAGVVHGRAGLTDGVIAFAAGEETLIVKGIECEVDGLPLCMRGAADFVRTRVWAEKGTLKIAWTMSGVKRDDAGSPRFTRLAAGGGESAPVRVYAGMGNVIERPERFTMPCNGFACSTRHVGADYANGMSLVQACDVFPDAVECDAAACRFALVTGNDATLAFTPSRRGAFDAVVRFAAVSGYRRSPGFVNLSTKIVLDDWSGGYARAAHELPLVRKYGLDAVYLQHNWQRWGYDVRLPEIWPPRGDRAAFDAMCAAARDAGIVLGLHDNYIDLYPDVPGFTYDDVYFTADGRPHEAWYNPGPRVLSYKWRPDAIWKWHGRNMRAMAAEAGVGALFIDVFTASSPKDWHDRSGRFHTRNEQADAWGAAFDRARTLFGRADAIMVSEAGHDALIGHVDAGEADHFTARRILPQARFADAERVPWHDAVSHGKMILLGGGLGGRYSGTDVKQPGADAELHGYASADYLCTTAIGGRGAMCDGPFSRKGVMTWWLLGGVLKELAAGQFRTFAFGRDIHEQHAGFTTGEVWINRATNRCWSVAGRTLPPYGLYARAGGHEAAIMRKDGLDVRVARSPGMWFVDARPPAASVGRRLAACRTVGFAAKGARMGELTLAWTVLDAAAGEFRPFVHAVRHGTDSPIVFQCGLRFADGGDALARPGAHMATISLCVPTFAVPGEYDIRYGLFHRKTGERTALLGWDDGTRRLFGGIVSVGADGTLAWRPDEGTARTRALGINVARRLIDFGGVATDGAFRVAFGSQGLTVTPLPGSLPFTARFDLKAFGLAGRRVVSVVSVDPVLGALEPKWAQEGSAVTLSVDACAFAYTLSFGCPAK